MTTDKKKPETVESLNERVTKLEETVAELMKAHPKVMQVVDFNTPIGAQTFPPPRNEGIPIDPNTDIIK